MRSLMSPLAGLLLPPSHPQQPASASVSPAASLNWEPAAVSSHPHWSGDSCARLPTTSARRPVHSCPAFHSCLPYSHMPSPPM